jgi:hypothetical protein
MKTKLFIIATVIAVLFTSCVQKTHKQTVKFSVDAKGIKNVKTVGLRGQSPLSWDYDLTMEIAKNSTYEATIIFETGYKYVDYKYTINNEYETDIQENRKLFFEDSKTTIVADKINVK